MKKLSVIVVLVVLGWYGRNLYLQDRLPFIGKPASDRVSSEVMKCITRDGRTFYGNVPEGTPCVSREAVGGAVTVLPNGNPGDSRHQLDLSSPGLGTERRNRADFRCDGRTHCSQMTSCAEATFFLRNCPGVAMDGNNDGVPCETQWCR